SDLTPTPRSPLSLWRTEGACAAMRESSRPVPAGRRESSLNGGQPFLYRMGRSVTAAPPHSADPAASLLVALRSACLCGFRPVAVAGRSGMVHFEPSLPNALCTSDTSRGTTDTGIR